MADTLKPLGQSAPAATTETDLYTCPAATQTVISNIVVCNRAAGATSFRISVSADGAATANKDYLYYDYAIAANSTYIHDKAVTVDASDKVRVYAGTANLSFNAFGVEVTA